jgi:hypothetical protein
MTRRTFYFETRRQFNHLFPERLEASVGEGPAGLSGARGEDTAAFYPRFVKMDRPAGHPCYRDIE